MAEVLTGNYPLEEGMRLVAVSVKQSPGKPLKDAKGRIFRKQGPGKVEVGGGSETARPALSQTGGQPFADDMPVSGTDERASGRQGRQLTASGSPFTGGETKTRGSFRPRA